MAYKGKFKPTQPEKYKGDASNIIWRSTWERKVMHWLDTKDDVVAWGSEEVVIPYRDPVEGRQRRYFVDFYARIKNKEGQIKTYLIEVKPKKQTMEPEKKTRITKQYIQEVYTYAVNKAKWDSAKEFCADKGWEFIILTEDTIYSL
jgi:hypothetical protein